MDNNKSTLDAKMKRLKVNNPVSHVFDVRVEIDENKKEHLYAIECCDYYYKSELTKEDCEKLAKYFKALSRMLD